MNRIQFCSWLATMALFAGESRAMLILSLTSGGLSAVGAAPSSSIPIEITITTDELLVAWQTRVSGDSAFSYAALTNANYAHGDWMLSGGGILAAAGNLPTAVPWGNTAAIPAIGAGSGLAFTHDLTVPATDGVYVLSFFDIIVGDLNFEAIPQEEIFTEPLTVYVPEPAVWMGIAALLPTLIRRRVA